jgi:hypothetical protein
MLVEENENDEPDAENDGDAEAREPEEEFVEVDFKIEEESSRDFSSDGVTVVDGNEEDSHGANVPGRRKAKQPTL